MASYNSLWLTVFKSPKIGYFDLNDDKWKEALKNSSNQIIWRQCSTCTNTHKDIFYKRITSWGNINIRNLFLDTWSSKPNGTSNVLNKDFELYSTYQDALNGNNKWNVCNYNDTGIGFPRDCGPSRWTGGQWKSWSNRIRDRNSKWIFKIEQDMGSELETIFNDFNTNLYQSSTGNDPKERGIGFDTFINLNKKTKNTIEKFENPSNKNIEHFTDKNKQDVATNLFNELINNYQVKLDYAASQEQLMSKQRTALNEKDKKINTRAEEIEKNHQRNIDTSRVTLLHDSIEQDYLYGLVSILKYILLWMCFCVIFSVLFPGLLP